MHITKLELKNFKRFTDLTLDLSALPQPPKLVLLIGANGSGKSSVFDAFEALSVAVRNETADVKSDTRYYGKSSSERFNVRCEFDDGLVIPLHNARFVNRPSGSLQRDKVFYGRSALRQVPQLDRKGIGSDLDFSKDPDRPRRFIHAEKRFENDISQVTLRILKEVFSGDRFDSETLRAKYIEPLNASLARIFGEASETTIALTQLTPALDNQAADVRFRKGAAEFHYDLLSNGEKQIVNLVLNFFVRREHFNDTIYFLDELDLHLHTKLQRALLREIVEHWLPENCQLWTASHSLGFIQYAREAEHAAILDFDDLNFDQPQTLTPQPKSGLEMFEVAVPRELLGQLFQGRKFILCENQNAALYNLLGLANCWFAPARDKNSVHALVQSDPSFFGLMDRDYLSDSEITRIQQANPRLAVLPFYCFESLLYHPDNLAEIQRPGFDPAAYRAEIVEAKRARLTGFLLALKETRNSYSVLKPFRKEDKEAGLNEVAAALESEDFQVFYPFYDMKGHGRQPLARYNLTERELVQTQWFRRKLEAALKPILS